MIIEIIRPVLTKNEIQIVKRPFYAFVFYSANTEFKDKAFLSLAQTLLISYDTHHSGLGKGRFAARHLILPKQYVLDIVAVLLVCLVFTFTLRLRCSESWSNHSVPWCVKLKIYTWL